MQAISLIQPWAQLVVLGSKRIETRSWPTKHRGVIAIHASKGFPNAAQFLAREHPAFVHALGDSWSWERDNLPRGEIVGTVEVTDCLPTEKADEIGLYSHHAEYAFGDYSAGRYMWLLANPVMWDEPIPCRGALKIWTVPEGIRIEE